MAGPLHYVEVRTDDGHMARIYADCVEVVKESKGRGGVPILTIITTRATIQAWNETMDSFWCKLEAACGSMKCLVMTDRNVPPDKRPPLREFEEIAPKPTAKSKAA